MALQIHRIIDNGIIIRKNLPRNDDNKIHNIPHVS